MEALTTLLTLAFDCILGLGLLWLAWRALTCPELFKAIVLFITFGLLMALAWVRLDAPDVALAEAAIGAGLTGALLLAAFAKLHAIQGGPGDDRHKLRLAKLVPAATVLFVVVGIGLAVISLPPDGSGLSSKVAAHLDSSGVSNPVTAVLLNFRGYDTLLEMIVLLVALLGVWSLGEAAPQHEETPGTVLDTFSRLLIPILILVAAYLLWVGAHAPGGAFQAGSVLAATGVLMLLSGWRPSPALMGLPLRFVLIAGPITFVAMAFVLWLVQGKLLEYPPEYAGLLILLLETAATFSIGLTLVALFVGGRPAGKEIT